MMDQIPPITILTVLSQALVYLEVIGFPWTRNAGPNETKAEKSCNRSLFSLFEHGEDRHLYYNIVSFLLKGRLLEKLFGSANFAVILIALTIMTSTLYVILGCLLADCILSPTKSNYSAAGFSGVVFALKVLLINELPTESMTIAGFQIPGTYLAWIELIISHILIPSTSCICHLAGILSGVLYCYTSIGKLIDKLSSKITGDKVVHLNTIIEEEHLNDFL